ncbi:hypothetical protein ICW40_06960 [Actinotalea ferrariae]|uniref:hypothetical protein n=1 Tax=Actinotalea ferrariae TaxID=1386098 RepID=UPI001C8BFA39|nr:hypothetical protein [Actinotalea ferrariae]MBX9244547.1 hypothetical protein [Actinotalea ferrariae]
MLAGAVLIPDTALLVPGASGRAAVLDEERAVAASALRALLAVAPDDVVLVVPGPAGGAPDVADAPPPTLGGAGLPDDLLRAGAAVGTEPRPRAGLATSVGLHALGAAGWTGRVRVLTAAGADAGAPAASGAALVAAPGRTALVLVGSLSARRGPDGPLPTDDRAPAFEDAVLADLLDLGPEATGRLAAVPAGLAAELAVSAWGPWQVLVGAGRPGRAPGRLLHRSAPFGATYVVLAWPGGTEGMGGTDGTGGTAGAVEAASTVGGTP